ncbi:hypothetical protein [Sphingobium lignivorans]|uniref:Uncharacterized protein n=1 Tax=Sphingobium lignivorans TaxID=2735886 RepID=A0ABR6NHE3_9SPHN|nr:hypothetical protein [Sphingobium lignivorans]MBB5985943.1 hypothetical protein [Sphingobium lignivorans]
MIIRIEDVRRTGFCVRGARDWANQNGIDFNRFLRDGIDAAELEATGDAMASRVIQNKISRESEA